MKRFCSALLVSFVGLIPHTSVLAADYLLAQGFLQRNQGKGPVVSPNLGAGGGAGSPQVTISCALLVCSANGSNLPQGTTSVGLTATPQGGGTPFQQTYSINPPSTSFSGSLTLPADGTWSFSYTVNNGGLGISQNLAGQTVTVQGRDVVAELLQQSQGGSVALADLQSILSAQGAVSGVDLNDSLNLAYVSSCISRLSPATATGIANCASSATRQAAVVHALSVNSLGGLTLSAALSEAGVASAVSSYAASGLSNSCGDVSCESALREFLQTRPSLTQANVETQVLTAAMTRSAANTPLTEAQQTAQADASPVTSCSVSAQTVAAPSLCGHQPATHIYCTVARVGAVGPVPTIDATGRNISFSTSGVPADGGRTYFGYAVDVKSRYDNRTLYVQQFRVAVDASGTQPLEIQKLSSCLDANIARYSEILDAMCANTGYVSGWREDTVSDFVRVKNDSGNDKFIEPYVAAGVQNNQGQIISRNCGGRTKSFYERHYYLTDWPFLCKAPANRCN